MWTSGLVSSLVLLLPFARIGALARSPFTHTSIERRDQCSLTQNWPTGPGAIVQPQPVSDELAAMLAEIDQDRIQAIIAKLVSFGTRHTASNQVHSMPLLCVSREVELITREL